MKPSRRRGTGSGWQGDHPPAPTLTTRVISTPCGYKSSTSSPSLYLRYYEKNKQSAQITAPPETSALCWVLIGRLICAKHCSKPLQEFSHLILTTHLCDWYCNYKCHKWGKRGTETEGGRPGARQPIGGQADCSQVVGGSWGDGRVRCVRRRSVCAPHLHPP